jgi:hypothetical protein
MPRRQGQWTTDAIVSAPLTGPAADSVAGPSAEPWPDPWRRGALPPADLPERAERRELDAMLAVVPDAVFGLSLCPPAFGDA